MPDTILGTGHPTINETEVPALRDFAFTGMAHVLRAYPVLGPVLRGLHPCIISVNSHHNPTRQLVLLAPFYRG